MEVSIHPTAAILTDDLSMLTIEGDDVRFRSSSMDRSYAQGFVRFSVVAGAPIVRTLRDERGDGLRDLHPNWRISPYRGGIRLVNRHVCEVSSAALTKFFETYSTSTVIWTELPDIPRGRGLDSYLKLESVEILDECRIHADLGYGWGFTIKPSGALVDEDLFTITIGGTDLDFETTSVHRLYREGWVRFFVVPNTPEATRARAKNGQGLEVFSPSMDTDGGK